MQNNKQTNIIILLGILLIMSGLYIVFLKATTNENKSIDNLSVINPKSQEILGTDKVLNIDIDSDKKEVQEEGTKEIKNVFNKVSAGKSPIVFDPAYNTTVSSNGLKISMKWKIDDNILNVVSDKKRLFVILDLVDENNKKIGTIGDGWNVADGFFPIQYPIWEPSMHTLNGVGQGLPTYKVKLKAKLSYQPIAECDPAIKGDCAPMYTNAEKTLINEIDKLPATYSDRIRFAE